MTLDATFVAVSVVLVVVAGLSACAESALTRMTRLRAEELVRDGRRGAARLRVAAGDPARSLNVLTLVRVSCELVATVFATATGIDAIHPRWRALLVTGAVMVVVSYVAVGVGPRTFGRQHPEGVSLVAARITLPLARFLGPLPKLLIVVGNAITPGKGFRDGPFASEAELRDLVDLAQENSVIQAGERAMIHSVFELGDTLVREVMVPRTEMVTVERTKTLRQAVALALRSGFSRIPVVGDGADDVVGVVYLKDLARRTLDRRDAESTERVESVMRQPTFVPESKPVDQLLREMQTANVHLAVVVDEYGGTAGLVTIEDILEEIVGEITDEYDKERPQVESLDPSRWRVSSRLHVEDLAELSGVEVDDDDVDTVGGLLAKHLGRVPIPGAHVEVAGLRLTAERAQGRRNRIGTVVVQRLSDEQPARDSEEHADA